MLAFKDAGFRVVCPVGNSSPFDRVLCIPNRYVFFNDISDCRKIRKNMDDRKLVLCPTRNAKWPIYISPLLFVAPGLPRKSIRWFHGTVDVLPTK